jgi:hypothetical protein
MLKPMESNLTKTWHSTSFHYRTRLRLTCGGTAATPTAAGRYVEVALALQPAGYSDGDAETAAAASLEEAVVAGVGTVTEQDFYSCQMPLSTGSMTTFGGGAGSTPGLSYTRFSLHPALRTLASARRVCLPTLYMCLS